MGKGKLNLNVFNGIMEETEVDVEKGSLEKLMDELGIQMSSSNEDLHKLLLWNDDVNNMEYVMECLMTICGINSESAFKTMLEAVINGCWN